MIRHGGPLIEIWSPEEVKAVHEASLRVLEEVGLIYNSDEAIEFLATLPGARVDRGEHRAWFSGQLVEDLVAKVPAQFTLRARNPARSVVVGNDTCINIPTNGAPYAIDLDRGRRLSTREDAITFIKLSHVLDAIDVVAPRTVEMQDVELILRPAVEVYTGFAYTDKPIRGNVALGREGVRDTLEIARIVFGDDDPAKGGLLYNGVNPISPLLYDERMCSAIIALAEAGQPMVVNPAAMAGITSPITLAGTMVQQNAEILGGIVLAQAVRPGVPMAYGMISTIGDMLKGQPAYGSPESALCIAAGAQLARFYKLPVRAGGSLTESKVPDFQAGLEGMLTTLYTVFCRTHINWHAVGMLDSFLMTSFEKFVMDAEILGYVERLVQGIPVNEETIAFEVIKEVGPMGMFLTADHTMANWRNAAYRPLLADRTGYHDWEKAGAADMYRRANRLGKELLSRWEVEPLPKDVVQAIEAVIARREKIGMAT